MCKFCESLALYKSISIDPDFTCKYSVALVSDIYRVADNSFRGRSTHYDKDDYSLAYCPECGQKIE